MEKKKCGQCGLVNWSGVMECVRCGAFISAKQVGVNPYADDGSTGVSGIRIAIIAVVVLVGGFIAYSAFSPAEPPKSPVAAGQEMSPADVQKLQVAANEAFRKDNERIAAELEKNAKSVESFRDFKMTPEMLDKSRKEACSQGVKNMGPC